jgi:hypothetical protein
LVRKKKMRLLDLGFIVDGGCWKHDS